jgi:hypothetical protein
VLHKGYYVNQEKEQMTHIVEENTSIPGWETLQKESCRQIRNIIRKKIIHSFLG